jgi:hypothetical protein
LLSALAWAGSDDEGVARAAFDRGLAELPKALKFTPCLLPAEQEGFAALAESLDRLASASHGIQAHTLQACTACVMVDNKLTLEEAELLRAIAILLDCPLPPFLPQPAVAGGAAAKC